MESPDYIGLAPVYHTSTDEKPDPAVTPGMVLAFTEANPVFVVVLEG